MGNACTIGRLREIFPDAYTDQDWQSTGVETPMWPGGREGLEFFGRSGDTCRREPRRNQTVSECGAPEESGRAHGAP